MSEHFTGPWKVRKNLPYAEYAITLDTGRVVAIFDDGSHGHRNKENAHRVAACVNAMEGVDDPAAFVRAAKEIGKRYATQLPMHREASDILKKLIDLFDLNDSCTEVDGADLVGELIEELHNASDSLKNHLSITI